MTDEYRIITPHMLRRRAYAEQARLRRVQARATDEFKRNIRGTPSERELTELGITAIDALTVRHENRLIYKWAVVVAR